MNDAVVAGVVIAISELELNFQMNKFRDRLAISMLCYLICRALWQ